MAMNDGSSEDFMLAMVEGRSKERKKAVVRQDWYGEVLAECTTMQERARR